ncbi:MAG TPA: DUF4129 domain-containing protein [Planctomycetota bacterium]|nr:DUF4129 domain-containing protein [Planctomycetota bacterium]
MAIFKERLVLVLAGLLASPRAGAEMEDLPGAEAVRSSLDRAFELPELRPKEKGLIEQAWDWVQRTIERAVEEFLSWIGIVIGKSEAAEIVVAVLLLVLLAILGHMVWTVLSYREKTVARPGPAPLAPGLPDTGAHHIAEAARLAADSRHLEAMQALYLGVLLSLDARGLVRFEASRTGGEYARQLSGSPLRRPFESFLRAHHPVLYGGRPARREAYETLRGFAGELGISP